MGRGFRTYSDRSWGHPTSWTMGTGSFPGVKSGQGVTLTPHPLLVPWSWKGRVIPLLPLWAVTACTEPQCLYKRAIYLYLYHCQVRFNTAMNFRGFTRCRNFIKFFSPGHLIHRDFCVPITNAECINSLLRFYLKFPFALFPLGSKSSFYSFFCKSSSVFAYCKNKFHTNTKMCKLKPKISTKPKLKLLGRSQHPLLFWNPEVQSLFLKVKRHFNPIHTFTSCLSKIYV